jgi:adenine phosphoribosyltransferase
MATLDTIKRALRQKLTPAESASTKQPLSDTQYSEGFDILLRGPGREIYENFIIPQLSHVVEPLFNSPGQVSVLEIGPGPKSVLGCLPGHLRRKIGRYAAFEPNKLFATALGEHLAADVVLPCLRAPPDIHPSCFDLVDKTECTGNGEEKFNLVLFCHSMYGMKPKRRFIEHALEMLVDQPRDGMVVVFHRDGTLRLDGLVCHRTASFPTGVVGVVDDDKVLECFAAFVAGSVAPDAHVRAQWRRVCRALGRHEEAHPNQLLFCAPEVMVAFTRHATELSTLQAELYEEGRLPLVGGERAIKNRDARLRHPATIVKPTKVSHVVECVRWALQNDVGLTVVGGGHSGHCLWDNVVAIDMSAFNQVHIAPELKKGQEIGSLVVVEAGCTTGDVIRKTAAAGLSVPLGARPSVGAGLWLQGGIGHMCRLHGLSCDAVVGAVIVSVDPRRAGRRVLCIGEVPDKHRPACAIQPDEPDLLWGLKGAGTNFGIVISVTFKPCAASLYTVQNWVAPLRDSSDVKGRLNYFEEFSGTLPRALSTDAYLYWDDGRLCLGVTQFRPSSPHVWDYAKSSPICTQEGTMLPPDGSPEVVDGVGLFETDMYISRLHGGHGGGKTSAFKRCIFLKGIGSTPIADILVAAIENRPTPFCYLHLLHGGGAASDVVPDATSFGCRDWDFACVVTGVWRRDQDGTDAARAAVRWVYDVAGTLLPLSSGAYGADLGPDPRDAALAAKAFGPNLPRLARLKREWDPRNVLAYACLIPKAPAEAKLIILVTGESCVGKDYCADFWASVFTERGFAARAVSISDVTKREYAAAKGADVNRLLSDREYKELHRPMLTDFFRDQVRQRPKLLEEHFLNVVLGAAGVDVLLITGMRDEAPVAAFSPLVSDSRLVEVRLTASEEKRRARRGDHGEDGDNKDWSGQTAFEYAPSFVFENNSTGNEAAKQFAESRLLLLCSEDLRELNDMVRSVPGFPSKEIEFRHVLGIAEQRGGLPLCTSLLQTHFSGDWGKVDVLVCCEAGGFVFASALALRANIPLALIRAGGKLPPPTVSIARPRSHVGCSQPAPRDSFEMGRDAVPPGATVVVVDDVLASGVTLCAVLELLGKAGVVAGDISVMVVAEFPAHGGRNLLRQRGFGKVNIQSLLVFGGF